MHPHQPPQHGSGQWQPGPSAPSPRRGRSSRTVVIALAIVLALLLATLAAYVVVTRGGDSEPTEAAGTAQDDQGDDVRSRVDPNYIGRGPDFPGRRSTDTSAQAGVTIERDGLSIRADKLEQTKSNNPEVPPGICATIRVENGTGEGVLVSPQMFVVVGPDGKEHLPARTADLASPEQMLQFELTPEEFDESVVCFDAPEKPEKGDYQLMYVGVAFYDQRLVWLNTL